MVEQADFLEDLAVVLCVAAPITVLFQRLRQPVVLGYLLAGLLIGPKVPYIGVSDERTVATLSELGVILLMFSLGLEFSFRRLLKLGPTSAVIGAVEVGLMVWLGFLAGRFFGWSTAESTFLGAILAISSTMVVAKTFAEQKTDLRLRELVFGILVVEDMAAILMLATLTTVAAGAGLSAGTFAWSTLKLVGFLVVLVAGGLLVVPRFLGYVARTGKRETTLVATVGTCFAAALLAHEFGYSVGLGAFLAGTLAAESGHGRSLEHLVRPVRDVFAAVFFVSVGMLIDPVLLWEQRLEILVFALLVICGKTIGVSLGAVLTGKGLVPSVRAGLSLTQIGEFSFLIAAVAQPMGGAAAKLYPVAVAVCVVTSFTSPYLVRSSTTCARWAERALPRGVHTFIDLYGTWLERIRGRRKEKGDRLRRLLSLLTLDVAALLALVIGVALSAPRALELLEEWAGVPTTFGRVAIVSATLLLVLPFALGSVRCIQQLGIVLAAKALPHADFQSPEGAEAPRRSFVLGLQLAIFLGVGLPVMAVLQPFLPPLPGILVLGIVAIGASYLVWRSSTRLEEHVRAGTVMISEALERRGGGVTLALDQVRELLPGLGSLTPVEIDEECAAAGKTLTEINLRGLSGASVVCIARGQEGVFVPEAKQEILAGDVLVLSGSREAVRTARALLERRAVAESP